MATYRYVAMSITTGQVLADSLPVVVTSAARQLCGTGQLAGYLPLQSANAAQYLTVLQQAPVLFFILQNGIPIWPGIVWDTPHVSVLDNRLPIQGLTFESLFTHRLFTGALTFTNADVLEIARGLVAYATSAALNPLGALANVQVPSLVVDGTLGGVTDTVTFGTSNTLASGTNTFYGAFADYQDILSALTQAAQGEGFEWDFAPYGAPGAVPQVLMRTGYPHVGNQVPVQQLTFPGNLADYARPRMASVSANQIIAMASASGSSSTYTSQAPNGVDTAALAAGAPLLQKYVAFPVSGTTSQAQVNQFVQSLLPAFRANTTVPRCKLKPDATALLGQMALGDALSMMATSALDPAGPNGEPGLQLTARLTGWTLVPPDAGQTESATLQLGQLAGEISTQAGV